MYFKFKKKNVKRLFFKVKTASLPEKWHALRAENR